MDRRAASVPLRSAVRASKFLPAATTRSGATTCEAILKSTSVGRRKSMAARCERVRTILSVSARAALSVTRRAVPCAAAKAKKQVARLSRRKYRSDATKFRPAISNIRAQTRRLAQLVCLR